MTILNVTLLNLNLTLLYVKHKMSHHKKYNSYLINKQKHKFFQNSKQDSRTKNIKYISDMCAVF